MALRTLLSRLTRARAGRIDPNAIDPLRDAERPDVAFETGWRPLVKGRVIVVLTVLGAWAVVVLARLVHLQVVQHDWLATRARNQQLEIIKPAAVRGDIVDREGRMLAYSVDSVDIIADPVEVKNDAATIRALCDALGDCTEAELKSWSAAFAGTGRWARLRRARDVSPQQARAVAEMKLRGITFVSESIRYYPRYDLAAHLLGYVGIDNDGLGGIESRLNDTIQGQQGRVLIQTDARKTQKGQMFARVEQQATAGATVELTIDLYLQHIAERELRAGVIANRAAGGTAIIMDPKTGEVLALANYPTYNPNAYNKSTDDDRRNRAVQDIYEPGSTFKIVTASAALEEGVLKTTDQIDCSPGYITFPGRKPITDVHKYGVLSFEDVIIKSSNVGAIKAGLRVGAERLSRYVRRFGFGEKLASDFAGESRGMVHNPADLNDSELASTSMGYHVGVTAMQMVTAVSAVANGGLLMEPHLVRATIKDGVREPVAPKVLRRAIASDTAATLTTIMEGVVLRGTAKQAALTRYQVAGKTGTAAKLVNGLYSKSDYNASFIGFVPSRKPAFAMVVVIDSPHAGRFYGGDVAAPIFKQIADAALQQFGVPSSVDPIPPVVVVADAEPAAAVHVTRATSVIPTLALLGGPMLMPDVRGMSGREALRVLGSAGLVVRMTGDGTVTTQLPQAGEPVEPGTVSALQLQRAASPVANGGGTR
jgi:cell division protein FtsI (penicillin-binding protein 3)